jgi:alanine racemase
MRPTRAEIHTERFLANLRLVRRQIGERARIMPIVKANAYGHGLDIIARAAVKSEEIDAFGVATEEEGARLRRLTALPILVLTGAAPDEIDAFLEHQLDFTLSDFETLRAIASRASALGIRARVHLKVDTGMRRMGIEPEETLGFLREIELLRDRIELVGLSTHFATSDEVDDRSSIDQTFFRKQLATFESVVREARGAGIRIPLAHAANSGAILQAPKESAFDLVRPGIMLYGYAPSMELQERCGTILQACLALVSTVVLVKQVKKGEGVSYNLRWHTEQDTRIATVPIGYGDGYPRLLTNRARAMIREKLYPVVGTICMDQVMLDVGADDIKIGDRVEFISATDPALSAWTLAETIGTIPYEILTGIAARVPRIGQ